MSDASQGLERLREAAGQPEITVGRIGKDRIDAEGDVRTEQVIDEGPRHVANDPAVDDAEFGRAFYLVVDHVNEDRRREENDEQFQISRARRTPHRNAIKGSIETRLSDQDGPAGDGEQKGVANSLHRPDEEKAHLEDGDGGNDHQLDQQRHLRPQQHRKGYERSVEQAGNHEDLPDEADAAGQRLDLVDVEFLLIGRARVEYRLNDRADVARTVFIKLIKSEYHEISSPRDQYQHIVPRGVIGLQSRPTEFPCM